MKLTLADIPINFILSIIKKIKNFFDHNKFYLTNISLPAISIISIQHWLTEEYIDMTPILIRIG